MEQQLAFVAVMPATRAAPCASLTISSSNASRFVSHRRPALLNTKRNSSHQNQSQQQRYPLAMNAANEAPSFDTTWDPAKDADYTEVRVYTMGPYDNAGSCMISLKPVVDAKRALRIQVVSGQVEAMQAALLRGKKKRRDERLMAIQHQQPQDEPEGQPQNMLEDDPSFDEFNGTEQAKNNGNTKQQTKKQAKPASQLPFSFANTYHAQSYQREVAPIRPSTHDLFSHVLEAQLIMVTKAAITHIAHDVYIARLWVRGAGGEEVCLDARPSDAITLALSNTAPIFLNRNLLALNGSDIAALEREVRRGFAHEVVYDEPLKTTSSLANEVWRRPEHLELSKLKMQLDLAVRLERFHEAAHLHNQIQKLCPLDELYTMLDKALREERFSDACEIRDQIYQWRLKLIKWELDK